MSSGNIDKYCLLAMSPKDQKDSTRNHIEGISLVTIRDYFLAPVG